MFISIIIIKMTLGWVDNGSRRNITRNVIIIRIYGQKRVKCLAENDAAVAQARRRVQRRFGQDVV
jgi:hypothetical protein